MGTNPGHHPPILLAEDEENDVYLMQHAFATAGLQNPLIAVESGAAAIAYLSGSGEYANRQRYPLPCLILVDLKMPGTSGFDFLAWLKQHVHFRHVPAIVLATSDEPRDRKRATELGAAAYWAKTLKLDSLMRMALELGDTWIARHCQPSQNPPGGPRST